MEKECSERSIRLSSIRNYGIDDTVNEFVHVQGIGTVEPFIAIMLLIAVNSFTMIESDIIDV